MSSSKEVAALLKVYWPELGAAQIEGILSFYALLLEGNKLQNLTRLVEPQDFVEGHVLDVQALIQSKLLGAGKSLDMGSGCGVPGLLMAVIQGGSWVLCDSEGRKAEFLADSVRTLGLKDVEVVSDRAERWLAQGKVETIVARAVGPVERIMGWIGECSTWNTLVLFKGPSWNAEWASFLTTRHKKTLKMGRTHCYAVGSEQKERIIVELQHVPRGTSGK